MFFENGVETVKDLHEAIKLFEGWLTATEEVVFRDFYGSSYQELCAYYETVKVWCVFTIHDIHVFIYLKLSNLTVH